MNVRTRWCSRSASSRPTALNTPGAGGTITVADAEAGGHLGGEQRAVAAERDDRELARVAAALDGHRADGARHPRAAEQEDAVRRVVERRARAAPATWSSTASPGQLGRRAAARSASRSSCEVAEDDVGVGQGRLGAAVGVAGRPGIAPALRGPTWSWPASSTRTMLPPPAPISAMSMAGTRSRKPRAAVEPAALRQAAADLELAGALDRAVLDRPTPWPWCRPCRR